MSEENLVELLERTASRVPDSDAPLPGLVRAGRRGLRRRRTAVFGGSVAAVLAVTGVGVVAHSLVADGTSPSVSDAPPAPPAGMKWSGIGQTVVAVPRTWSMWPGLVCPTVDGHDHVTIAPAGVVASCVPTDPRIPASDLISLRDQDRTLVVSVDQGRRGSTVTQPQIETTKTTLPDGWLAVPAAVPPTRPGDPTADEEASALAAAGFQVAREQEPRWDDGPLARTEPEMGAPARVGSTVTVYERLPAPASAGLSGRLLWVGGLAPGTPEPHAGTVHIVGGGVDKYIPVGRDGRWSFDGPAGTFTVTGTSPGYPDLCRAVSRVTLSFLRPTKGNVYCQLR